MIGLDRLPEKSTFRQLQGMYETILNRRLDKRHFRKKILRMDLLREHDEYKPHVAHRAARLYRFNKAAYAKLRDRGFPVGI